MSGSRRRSLKFLNKEGLDVCEFCRRGSCLDNAGTEASTLIVS